MAPPSRNRHRGHAAATLAGALALLVLGLLLASCGGGTPSGQSTGTRYYVSLGDSYAVGFQPSPQPGGATGGYTAVVASRTHLTLVNFGCGGATTTSILRTDGCTHPYGPPAATSRSSYPHQTQAAAAEAFLRAHRGHVGLVTVSIGGNDVTDCAKNADPVSCVGGATTEIKAHVSTLAKGLRAAAGTGVPILGLTYPDVILGEWVYPPSSPDTTLASLSVTAFKSLINPALRSAYATGGARFVDVTSHTAAYVPLTRTTALAPYGTIPVAVATVCKLTWYCKLGNIHATTTGYHLIGHEIVAAYRVGPH
ncbi:MAG: GDSL-type esterase/lipase family protein [Acidimicrobiales bacterium]